MAADASGVHDPAPAGPAGVWLVVGVQAAGKTTVADLLARSFPRGVHVPGGAFYRWAVTGWTHPREDASDPAEAAEARRLLDLRYDLAAGVADRYAAAGFETVVQDNLYGPDVPRWLAQVRARPRRLVVLRPSPEVVLARDAGRQAATGKVAYRPGETSHTGLQQALDATPRLGLWLDTSELTPEATVEAILDRNADALVPDDLAPGDRPAV